VIILAVLVLAVVGAVVLGAGALAGDDGDGRPPVRERLFGGAGPALGIVVLLGVLVVLFVLPLLLMGVRGGSGDDGGEGAAGPEPDREETTTTAAQRVTTTTVAASPADEEADGSGSLREVSGPQLRLNADESPGFPPLPPVADELEAGSVLRVRAVGFPADVTGEVVQCLSDGGRLTGCRNAFPVRFDETGRAYFQYLVVPLRGGCRLDATACVLAVRALDGELTVSARTVFGDAVPPPGRVAVEPRTGLRDGDTVTVSVAGFPARTAARVVQCAAPAVGDPAGCGAPGPPTMLAVGPGGTGTTAFTVRTGAVGSAGARCGRGTTCGIAVVPEDGAVVARAAPLSFAAGPGAGYEGSRLAAGLGAAALLLVIALVLVRRTDWREPTEAATPEMDATSLEVPEFDLGDEDDELVDA